MAAYRLLLIVSLLICATYALIAFDTHPRRNQEFFPFFTWSLFSYSGAERDDYTLAIVALDDETFDAPVLAIDIADRMTGLKRDHRFRKIMWRWASAVYFDDQTEADAMRRIVETRYFANADFARYQFVQIKYKPLERYRDRSKVEIVRQLGEHEYARAGV